MHTGSYLCMRETYSLIYEWIPQKNRANVMKTRCVCFMQLLKYSVLIPSGTKRQHAEVSITFQWIETVHDCSGAIHWHEAIYEIQEVSLQLLLNRSEYGRNYVYINNWKFEATRLNRVLQFIFRVEFLWFSVMFFPICLILYLFLIFLRLELYFPLCFLVYLHL